MDAWVRWPVHLPGVILVSLLEAPARVHSASLRGPLHAGRPDPRAKVSQRPPRPLSESGDFAVGEGKEGARREGHCFGGKCEE